jgi:hypothetical protein
MVTYHHRQGKRLDRVAISKFCLNFSIVVTAPFRNPPKSGFCFVDHGKRMITYLQVRSAFAFMLPAINSDVEGSGRGL